MKYSRLIILSIVALFLYVGSALAVPVYSGPTYGPSDMTGTNAGYYITSDEAATSWSVNWTSGSSDSDEHFFGSIVAGGVTVEWVNGNTTVYNSSTLNFMDYSTGSGFGFTTSGVEDNILFNLGSSAESFGIYAGEEENPIADYIPQEYVGDGFDGVLKSFEIAPAPVPEPATMFLLGSGLFGLAGFGRKRFSKKG